VVTKCPTTSLANKVTIEGTLSEINDLDSISLTINDKPINYNRFDYNSGIYTWSYNTDMKEGINDFKIVAKINEGKIITNANKIKKEHCRIIFL
jgi:hypothetical protein